MSSEQKVNDARTLHGILSKIDTIHRKMSRYTTNELSSDEVLFDSVILNINQISMYVRMLSKTIKNKYNIAIDWNLIEEYRKTGYETYKEIIPETVYGMCENLYSMEPTINEIMRKEATLNL